MNTDCLSANQIKDVVAYFNQYTINMNIENLKISNNLKQNFLSGNPVEFVKALLLTEGPTAF